MMNYTDIVFLAVALAMDCFTVSLASGVILGRWQWGVVVRMSLLFGLFQALMPLAGWLGVAGFARHVEVYSHWIAFLLLAFLGVKMIRESLLPEERRSFDPRLLRTQLLLAVATSIDALAIGFSLALTGYRTVGMLAVPLVVIGLTSSLFTLVGHLLGIRFGRVAGRHVRPEILGGIILLAIGFKVLFGHL